jgi:hypothetical protein
MQAESPIPNSSSQNLTFTHHTTNYGYISWVAFIELSKTDIRTSMFSIFRVEVDVSPSEASGWGTRNNEHESAEG